MASPLFNWFLFLLTIKKTFKERFNKMNRTGEEQQEIRKILKDYSDERELEKLILMLSCTVLVRKKKMNNVV